jgi:hypothetical protein
MVVALPCSEVENKKIDLSATGPKCAKLIRRGVIYDMFNFLLGRDKRVPSQDRVRYLLLI